MALGNTRRVCECENDPDMSQFPGPTLEGGGSLGSDDFPGRGGGVP